MTHTLKQEQKSGAGRCLLLVDMGNTCMVFGLYREENLLGRWYLSSERSLTADELALKLRGLLASLPASEPHGVAGPEAAADGTWDVDGIMAASVVPHLDPVLLDACLQVFGKEPQFVGSSSVKTGMAVDYKNPREVGADRIVNALAAREAFGAPVIVLDCGTATTFDIVSPEGHYAGGLIMPGIEVSLAALIGRAAKLPEVSFTPTRELIGRDTVGSMQAGSYWAAVDGLSGIIRRLKALPEYAEAPVVATGGLSGRLVDALPGVDEYRPLLTLHGLLMLARRHFR